MEKVLNPPLSFPSREGKLNPFLKVPSFGGDLGVGI